MQHIGQDKFCPESCCLFPCSGRLYSGYFGGFGRNFRSTQDVVTTGLTTGNINSTYYFRYNTNGSTASASSFNTSATYSNNRVRFGNSNSARYVLLCSRGNTPVAFYSVTLDYSRSGTGRASQVEYVQSGMAPELRLAEEFLWYDANGSPVTEMPKSITGTTTLYAQPKAFTVTFQDAAGNQLPEPCRFPTM